MREERCCGAGLYEGGIPIVWAGMFIGGTFMPMFMPIGMPIAIGWTGLWPYMAPAARGSICVGGAPEAMAAGAVGAPLVNS